MRTFKKALSVFLCFVMLFTTFCFFPLTGLDVKADAEIVAGEGNRTAFYAPEVIYLYPNVKSWKETTVTPFQYYVGNTVDTSDIYAVPEASAVTSEKGVLYFASEEGMKSPELSYTFKTKSGDIINGGSVTFNMTAKDGYYEIAVTEGKSPELDAQANGCFLQWKMQYVTDEGEHKAAFAVSYVYKPYVMSYGAVAKAENNYNTHNIASENITWVSGVHSIDTTAPTKVAFYPYFTTVADGKAAKDFAFSPFLSKGNMAFVGVNAVSGQAPVEKGGYNAVFSAGAEEIAYFYAGQPGAPLDAHNFAENWFSTNSADTNIYTPATFDHAEPLAQKQKYVTAQVTPTRLGAITIDTSRYTNLNEIPNLAVGFMITSNAIVDGGAESDGSVASGIWKVGDASGYTRFSATGMYTDMNTQSYALLGIEAEDVFAEANVESFPIANGIKYAGAWNKAINTEAPLSKYTVNSVVQIKDNDKEWDYTVTSSAIGLNATHINKASLREAVYEASSYSGALGMKKNEGSLYYAALGTEWKTFFKAYYNAYVALTQLDATAADVASAEAALEAALETLLSGKSLKVLFDVNYDGINPNLLAVAELKPVDGFSVTYNSAAETYTFNGTIDSTTRPFKSDISISEGAYTVTADHISGTRTVAEGVVSTVALEFFKGEDQPTNRVVTDMYAYDVIHTYNVDETSAGILDNFRMWFWVQGEGSTDAVSFDNLIYKFKLEEGSSATAYSPAAKIVDGTTYGTLPVPERDGYSFGGWYADKACTTEITAESEISARVLYAKWIPNVYSVSFENIFSLNAWANTGNSIVTRDNASSGNNATYNSADSSVTIVSDARGGECYTTYGSESYAVKVLPNTSYRFSYKVSGRNEFGTTIVFAFLFDANGNSIGFADNDNYASKNKTEAGEGEYYIDFTTGETADLFRGRFGTHNGTGTESVEATFSDVRLVEVNDYNNSVEISYPEKAYKFGTSYGELATATREGYVFDGWYTEKNGDGDKITESTPVISGNITLYSNWVANGYTVTFNGNGADGGSAPVPSTLTCVYDKEFTLPANGYFKTGHSFAGWSTAPDGEVLYTDKQTVKNVTSEENAAVTLYAIWTPNKYTVRFDANTGTGTMADAQVSYQGDAALPECGFTKPGYSFVGWSRTNSGSSVITQAQYNILTPTAGDVVTLYAVWSENNYTVTFNSNDEANNSFDEMHSYTDSFVLPTAAFARTGYILSGWALSPDGEMAYTTGQSVSGLNADKNGNITLYAVWTPVTYNIKFSGGANGIGVMDAIKATYDAKVVLPENKFTRTGYHFIGWATVEGGAVVYENGAEAMNLSADQNGEATLYAVWEINMYKVKFTFRTADGTWSEPVTVMVPYGGSVSNNDIEGFVQYPAYMNSQHYVFSRWDTGSGTVSDVKTDLSVSATYSSASCTLSTTTHPSTCAVKGKDVTTCAYCSYVSEKELELAEHTYDAGVITKPATCLANGVKTFTCSVCNEGDEGHVKTKPVTAAGHTFTDKHDTDSTCAQQGFIAHRFCSACNKAYAPGSDIKTPYENALTNYMKEVVPHTAGEEATCTTAQICTVCNTVLVEALGHKYTVTYEADTPVNCSTISGDYTILETCSVCNTVEKTFVENSYLPHSFEVETVDPTCTEDGYDLHICTVCAHEEEDNFTEKLGHDTEGKDWEVKTEATCSEEGEKVIICNRCNEAAETDVIEKLPHTSGDWVVTKEATCTEKGVKSHYCTVCEEVYETQELPKADHDHQWTTVTEADCENDGLKQKKCTVCGDVAEEEVISKLGHKVTEYSAKAPTCTEIGWDAYVTCSRCDYTTYEEKEALGHDWNNGYVTKEPTETEVGEKEYTCLRDFNHKKYVTVPVRIVIVLPEIPADGTYDLDASETRYLGNIHDIISVEKGIAYTVSVDNENVLTINEDGHMMAVKDGNAVITITTNDGKYQKHLPVSVRTYRTITFDVNGVLSTTKAYVGERFETITVESYEDEYGYKRQFKAWLHNGMALTEYICTGEMTLVAQFTSSCDYYRFDRMAIVFESLIGGYYDNDDLIALNKQAVEDAKALVAEFRADRNIRDSAEQGRVDAAADQISIVVAKIYPEENASIEIRGATDCKAGSYADVKAYLMPVGLELVDGVWTSSDTSIGFFTDGRFFAVRTGTVTLTVSRGNLTESIEITVTAPSAARVVFFDSLLTNAHYILEGGYVISDTTNLFWAPDADINFRVITDGTFEEYVVYVNDKKVTPDITGTYTVAANTGDAHVRIEGMVPDYTEDEPGTADKVSIWDLIRNFFKKIGDFFRNLFGM